jgi:hypothetical protein
LALDRDRDGYRNRLESALGSDPADAGSIPSVTAVDAGAGAAPAVTRLHANRPNPFNPATVIPYDVGRAARVRVEIFDVRGRAVRRLVDAVQKPGRYEARWDGRDDGGALSASGRYYVRLTVGFTARTRGIVLVK